MGLKGFNVAPAPAAAAEQADEFEVDFFKDHVLTKAVQHECRDSGVTESQTAWLVEATLFQLQRLVRAQKCVDLGYLGKLELEPWRLIWRGVSQ